jgi:hypothetical protein
MLTADGTVKDCISTHDQSSMNLPPTCFLSMAATIKSSANSEESKHSCVIVLSQLLCNIKLLQINYKFLQKVQNVTALVSLVVCP